MKILVVTQKCLYPMESGIELREFNLIKPLADNHEISLISFIPDIDLSEKSLQILKKVFIDIELIPLENTPCKNVFLRLLDWISPSEFLLGPENISKNMKSAVLLAIEKKVYDILFISSPFIINHFLYISDIPIVLDLIDDPSLFKKREIKTKLGLPNKFISLKDWLFVRKLEKKFLKRFDEIILSSPIDAEVTKKFCPTSNLTVIPNGVDLEYFNSVGPISDKPILIFVGVMNYPPNETAMIYFCQRILPLISFRVKDVRLLIVGRNPTDKIFQLKINNSSIEVIGGVEDIRPYIAKSSAFVCPLISGAGIKNKILEAWAAGRPVIATSLACHGINVTPKEDILIADDPLNFANAVVSVLTDKTLAQKLAINGKEKAIKFYDWHTKAEKLEKVFLGAIKISDGEDN